MGGIIPHIMDKKSKPPISHISLTWNKAPFLPKGACAQQKQSTGSDPRALCLFGRWTCFVTLQLCWIPFVLLSLSVDGIWKCCKWVASPYQSASADDHQANMVKMGIHKTFWIASVCGCIPQLVSVGESMAAVSSRLHFGQNLARIRKSANLFPPEVLLLLAAKWSSVPTFSASWLRCQCVEWHDPRHLYCPLPSASVHDLVDFSLELVNILQHERRVIRQVPAMKHQFPCQVAPVALWASEKIASTKKLYLPTKVPMKNAKTSLELPEETQVLVRLKVTIGQFWRKHDPEKLYQLHWVSWRPVLSSAVRPVLLPETVQYVVDSTPAKCSSPCWSVHGIGASGYTNLHSASGTLVLLLRLLCNFLTHGIGQAGLRFRTGFCVL